MKCHYAVLDVPRSATGVDIRKAYRNQALKWHPDKNPDCPDEAHVRFQEIQTAYSVLSDKHERAWYDAHRETILMGKDPSAGNDDEDKDPADFLWSYFGTSCFKGFSQGGGGDSFYDVYEGAFQQISDLEALAEDFVESRGKGAAGSSEGVPKFGGPQTPWTEVYQFYTYWSNFTSKRTFAMAGEYNPAEAPSRRIRRVIEAENKKKRLVQKRKFNSVVARLAAHVKKLDPRVRAHEMEVRRKKAEEDRLMQQRKNARLNRGSGHLEAQSKHGKSGSGFEWDADHVDELEALLEMWEFSDEDEDEDVDSAGEGVGEGEGAYSDSNSIGEQEKEKKGKEKTEYFCVACKKSFKSAGQWSNHERSKKHKEAVDRVRNEVLMEGDFDEGEEEEEEEVVVEEEKEEVVVEEEKEEKVEEEEVEKEEEVEEKIEVKEEEKDEVKEEVVEEKVKPRRRRRRAKSKDKGVEGPAAASQSATVGGGSGGVQDKFTCGKCNSLFNTRNKLFRHLSKTGHTVSPDVAAALVSGVGVGAAEKGMDKVVMMDSDDDEVGRGKRRKGKGKKGRK